MQMTSMITNKGQITLPVKIRKDLGLGSGDTVIFNIEDDHLVIRKEKNIESFFNTLPPLSFSFKERIDDEMVSEIRGNE